LRLIFALKLKNEENVNASSFQLGINPTYPHTQI